jgi:ubiquinone/menaquinone biosynthesis C-methylase UbiE
MQTKPAPVARSETAGRRSPDYDPLLRAFHVAFAPELRRIIADLPLTPEARVLDLCCGDGHYTAFLAERLGTDGELVAADLSDAYLERTAKRFAAAPPQAQLRLVKANAYSLPFEEESFDLVWCAQSFISLERPVAALREMARVLRPGGRVAILENDEYHHVLLPWPVELEMAVQRAIVAGVKERYGSGGRIAPARRLPAMLREAGFKPRRKKTYPADRQQPFTPAVRRFLRLHMRFLRDVVRDRLSSEQREGFDLLVDDRHDTSFLRLPECDLTCLNVLYLASRSG